MRALFVAIGQDKEVLQKTMSDKRSWLPKKVAAKLKTGL
jgi:hypothetical protein